MNPLENLHNSIIQNLCDNDILAQRIAYGENCVVGEYMMGRVLVNEEKSPYYSYNGKPFLPNNLIELLMYTIYCAPIYASVKSANSFAQDYWDYWRFHQKLADKLYFPFATAVLPFAEKTPVNSLFLSEFDNKLVFSIYRSIYETISKYFDYYNIENSIIHPQEDATYSEGIESLLVNMHDVGLMLFGSSRSKEDIKLSGVNLCPHSTARQLFMFIC